MPCPAGDRDELHVRKAHNCFGHPLETATAIAEADVTAAGRGLSFAPRSEHHLCPPHSIALGNDSDTGCETERQHSATAAYISGEQIEHGRRSSMRPCHDAPTVPAACIEARRL